jgi:hypothetical protein
MAEAARRLTDAADGFLAGHRVLSCERDGQGTEGLRHNVEGAGVRIGPPPIPVPTANADAGRFVSTSREEYLDRLTLFGERRLRCPLDEFVAHSHGERNHQGLGNELIAPETLPAPGPMFGAASGWAGSRHAARWLAKPDSKAVEHPATT